MISKFPIGYRNERLLVNTLHVSSRFTHSTLHVSEGDTRGTLPVRLSLSMHFKNCVFTFILMLRFKFQFKKHFLFDVDTVHRETDSHKHLLFP